MPFKTLKAMEGGKRTDFWKNSDTERSTEQEEKDWGEGIRLHGGILANHHVGGITQ